MYTIQNDYVNVTIDEKGAALWSVRDNSGHPGFYVPMDAKTRFEDWYLEFDTIEDVKRVCIE